jgi:hypothetical protein
MGTIVNHVPSRTFPLHLGRDLTIMVTALAMFLGGLGVGITLYRAGAARTHSLVAQGISAPRPAEDGHPSTSCGPSQPQPQFIANLPYRAAGRRECRPMFVSV